MPIQYNRRQPIFVVGPSIAYIPLTRGFYACVDACDAEFLAQRSWSKAGNYACTSPSAGPHRRMHRILMGSSCQHVDHVNGCGLDNRRANLRPATASQNHYNKRCQKNNKSGYKGVHMVRKTGRWVAQISVNRRGKHLGVYATPEEASDAYMQAAQVFAGEFANRGVRSMTESSAAQGE